LRSFIATRPWSGDRRKLAVCFWTGTRDSQGSPQSLESLAGRPVAFEWKPAGAFVTCPKDGYGAYPVRVSRSRIDATLVLPSDRPRYFVNIGRAAPDRQPQSHGQLALPGQLQRTI